MTTFIAIAALAIVTGLVGFSIGILTAKSDVEIWGKTIEEMERDYGK